MLEVPVGTGILTMPMYQKLKNADITCLDYSKEMMAHAENRATNMNIKNISFVQGDVGKLPFESESFDAVICCQSFHHYTSAEAFFDSVSRVLQKGGRLILRDMSTECTPAYWFANKIEMPLINHIARRGDVRIYNNRGTPIRKN